MADDLSDIEFVGFDDVQAANFLLRQIGIDSDLDAFLASLVEDVLKKQFDELRMISVALITIGECSIEGKTRNTDEAINCQSINIPIQLETYVEVKRKQYRLSLDVAIRATAGESDYQLESDVRIIEQSIA